MENINKYIDHTCLKPDASAKDILKLCEEAKENQFSTVCVSPHYIELAKKALKNSEVRVCTVIGFPLGNQSSLVKEVETKEAIERGASEIDMVMNISSLKNKDYAHVEEDIKKVIKASQGNTVKVILETCLLSDEEIKRASEISVRAGAQFIKTSTGFSSGGATISAVKIMLSVAKEAAQVKASGGIRSYKDAMEYINLGVTRLGTSSSVAIVKGSLGPVGTY